MSFHHSVHSPNGLDSPIRPNLRRLLLVALTVAFMLTAVGCKQSESNPETYSATDVAGANFAKDFSLTDHNGQHRTLADFKGKVVILFFGYIQCPDICSNTLSELAAVMQRLGAKADGVQVLFVTLDPERDTPSIMSKFVSSFNPKFLGLYASPAQIAETAKEFKLFYQKQPGKSKQNYTLDHSSGTYIYDASGKLRLYASYELGVDALVADIQLLLME